MVMLRGMEDEGEGDGLLGESGCCDALLVSAGVVDGWVAESSPLLALLLSVVVVVVLDEDDFLFCCG